MNSILRTSAHLYRAAAGSAAVLTFASVTIAGSAFAQGFALVEDGEPRAVIVIPSGGIDAISPWLTGAELRLEQGQSKPTFYSWTRAGVRPAVEDFNEALARCVGCKLPVLAERTAGRRAILFEVRPAALMEDDGFSIDFPEADTMLIKGSGRSVRWALNHVLEEYAGVRWLFLDHAHYPQSDRLTVPRKSVRGAPSYGFRRNPGYYRPRMLGFYLGLNAKFPPLPRQEGGHAMLDHAFPLEKYAPDQSWPVEIMPVRTGEKLVLPRPEEGKPLDRNVAYMANWHPCFSSPKTVHIAVENILETMAADPNRQLVGLGVMDRGGHCECEECREAVGGEKNAMGMPDYSDLYYRWASKVAERVVEEYPQVVFDVIAYREVFNPPSFKLHPHIVVCLCVDIQQTMDPEVSTEKWALIEEWAEKAQYLALWEYASGMNGYALPRVYYHLHADFIKRFHRLGGVGAKFSGWTREGSEGEGPKLYLAMKLYWNADLDPDEVIDEWMVTTVGKRAAPFLHEYFRFWEDYCTGERIRKTEWYRSSCRNQYLRIWDWNRTRSYTFALQKGDMARLRRLMQQVVAGTETAQQAERAQRLMLTFEYYEANAYALFSEIVPPEGELTSAGLAVEMIEGTPKAYEYAEKQKKILERISAGKPASALRIVRGHRKFDIHENLVDIFGKVGRYLGDRSVQSALDELQDSNEFPAAFKQRLLESCRRTYKKAQGRTTTPRAQAGIRSAKDVEIDGRLDEPFWDGLPAYALCDLETGAPPRAPTSFRMAWTGDALVVGVRCEEPDMDGLTIGATEDGDMSLFSGDSIEVLIETPVHSYYQLAINPAGALVDLDRSKGIDPAWSSGAVVAAHAGDDYWSVEMRIPIARPEDVDVDDRGVEGAKPTQDAPWHFNVCRLRVREDEKSTSAFSATGGGFHVVSRFAKLVAR